MYRGLWDWSNGHDNFNVYNRVNSHFVLALGRKVIFVTRFHDLIMSSVPSITLGRDAVRAILHS